MELTFLDLTLPENSLLRNKQASTPAAVRKTAATTMGTRASTMLFCDGCCVVTVGGVSAVSVAFLVSLGRAVAATDSVVTAEAKSVIAAVPITSVVLAAAVGDVDASATGAFAAFSVAVDVGCRVVGTLFATVAGLGGCVVLAGTGDGGCLLGGAKTPTGKPAAAPLTGIDGGGGGGGRNCDGR